MNHPAKIVIGDDEDYVKYLGRQADAWSQSPPEAPPGFVLAECDAEPRHWPTYTVADDDFYETPCPVCQIEAAIAEHAGCQHSRHRAWRRWWATRRLAGWLYASGLTSSGGSASWGGGCNWCVTMPSWNRNRRSYVLWVSTDHWRCLLKHHHWPADHIAFGFCSKCLPCPDCGSKTAGHNPECEYA